MVDLNNLITFSDEVWAVVALGSLLYWCQFLLRVWGKEREGIRHRTLRRCLHL
jgi:hypothetical protein